MKRLLCTLGILAAFCVSSSCLQGQCTLDGMYSRLSTFDGLSSNSINQTISDHNGYIYFATTNGLDRYDGKNLKRYRHDPNNKRSLSHNKITCLLVDNKNRLWVGTNNGLNLKGEDDTFVSFRNNPTSPKASNKIGAILQDHLGRIWIGTQSSLYLYDEENQNFHEVPLDPIVKEGNYKEAILSLYEDNNNILWVSTWNKGLTILDLNQKNIESICASAKRLNQNTIHTLENNNFSNLFEDSNNRIWAQQYNGHLYRLDYPKDKSISEIDLEELTFIKAPIFESEIVEYSIMGSHSLRTKNLRTGK